MAEFGSDYVGGDAYAAFEGGGCGGDIVAAVTEAAWQGVAGGICAGVYPRPDRPAEIPGRAWTGPAAVGRLTAVRFGAVCVRLFKH